MSNSIEDAKVLLQSVKTMIDSAVTKLPFNKTKKAIVKAVNEDKTADIEMNGQIYENVKVRPSLSPYIGEVVSVCLPLNNTKDMYIDLCKNVVIEGETAHSHNNLSLLESISQSAIDLWNTVSNKVDKVTGKGLSSEDYTTLEKTKLAGIADNANNYVHPSTHSADIIVDGTTNKAFTATEKTKLANLSTVATSGSYNDLSNKPTIPTDTNQLTKTDVYTKIEVNNLISSSGGGDMLKSIYDTNNDGKVDSVEDNSHNHTISTITDFPSSLPANGGNADTVDNKHASDFLLRNNTLETVNRYRDVGYYYGGTSTNTGCIVINVGTQNVMIVARITLRSYLYSGTIIVGGYTYTGTANWYMPTSTGIISSGTFNVRFIGNGTQRYIVIGEPTTAWGGYLHVNIDEMSNGYGGVVTTPFIITLDSALPTGTVSATQVINGSGSGLDADKLDGYHASSFLIKSGGTMTGGLVGHTGTDYTTKRFRNIQFKTGADFTTSELTTGDIGYIY